MIRIRRKRKKREHVAKRKESNSSEATLFTIQCSPAMWQEDDATEQREQKEQNALPEFEWRGQQLRTRLSSIMVKKAAQMSFIK